MKSTDTGSGWPDPAFDLALAMLTVLTRRLGTEFAREVRAELLEDAARFDAFAETRNQLIAIDERKLAAAPFWGRLGVTE